jgi:hypothetical protein
VFKIFGVIEVPRTHLRTARVNARSALFFNGLRAALKDPYSSSCAFRIPLGHVGGIFAEGTDQTFRKWHDPRQGTVLLAGTPGNEISGRPMTPQEALRQYRAKGPEFLRDMEGIFSCIIFDHAGPDGAQLLIANDKAGFFPLYYFEDGGLFAFCSEAEPLLRSPYIRMSLDHDSIAQFFCCGYILHGRTFVREIRNFGPATALEFSGGKKRTSVYFTWESGCSAARKEKDVLAGVYDALSRGIASFLPPGGKVFTALTGGRDTRMIASMLKGARTDLTAITFRNERTDLLDVALACRVAKHLKIRHELISIPSYAGTGKEPRALKLRGVRLQDLSKNIAAGLSPVSRNGAMRQMCTVPHFSGLMGGEVLGRDVDGYDLKGDGAQVQDIFSAGFIRRIERLPGQYLAEAQKEVPFPFRANTALFFFLRHILRSYFNVIEGDGWERPAYNFVHPARVFPFLYPELLLAVTRAQPGKEFYLQVYKRYHPESLGMPFLSDYQVRGRALQQGKERLASAAALARAAKVLQGEGIIKDFSAVARIFPRALLYFSAWFGFNRESLP